MRKLLTVIVLFLLSILGMVLLFNAATHSSKQTQIQALSNLPNYPDAAARLAKILPAPKDSSNPTKFFTQLYPQLQEHYADIFNNPNIEWQQFDGFNLVIKWIGRTPELAPVLLVANQYDALPFIQNRDSSHLYLKGGQHQQLAMFAMLEAFQHLIRKNTLSNRTIYFAFPENNDEGELAILQALQQARITPEFIVKMGGGICQSQLWDIANNVALIGVGHQAIVHATLETNDAKADLAFQQVQKQLSPALPALEMEQTILKEFLSYISPELGFGQRFFFANQWLFSNVVQKRLQNNSFTQNLFGNSIHISTISTDSSGKTLAKLVFAAPSAKTDLEQWIKKHLKLPQVQLIGQAHIIHKAETISPISHHGYRAISNSSKEIFPEMLSAPILVQENSPVHWQAHTQSPIYYFQPSFFGLENEEKISLKNYTQMIQFYQRLLLNNI